MSTAVPTPSTTTNDPATVQPTPQVEGNLNTDNNETNEDGEEWKPPSQRCSKEDLKINHKHHVRYPEEWNIAKFGFGPKPTEKGASGYGKKVWINHKDAPFRGKESGMHVLLPQMRVTYAGESQDEKTLEGKGFKMSLSADSSIYHVENNDQNNFVNFAESLDKHVVKYAFEHKDTWFKGDADKLEEERDVWKRYMPIADFGAVGGDYPNPWVDENGNTVDGKTFEGKKHRKYGPKFWFGLSKTGSDKTGSWVWSDDEFKCEFLDGYTGKQMDITPKNLKEFMEANENIKAQGVFTIMWVQLLKETFKVKLQLAQVHFFPKSSRPMTEADPLPRGLGLNISAPELKSEKVEGAADTAKSVVSGDVKVEPSPSITEAGVKTEPTAAAAEGDVVVGVSLLKTAEEPAAVAVSVVDPAAEKAALQAGTLLGQAVEPPAAAPKNDAEYMESLKRSAGVAVGAVGSEGKDEKKSHAKKIKTAK